MMNQQQGIPLSYHLSYQKETDSYSLYNVVYDPELVGETYKLILLQENIPAGVIKSFMHRLVCASREYELEGKDKAYGGD